MVFTVAVPIATDRSMSTSPGAETPTQFATAVQPLQATVIRTDTAGLTHGDAGIAVGDTCLPIYFARPQGDARVPVVLVVQEIFGLHEHIRDICRRLAKEGYLAIAAELYFRQGDPAALDSIEAIVTSILPGVSDAQVLGDLDACASWSISLGGDSQRLAITGFCWGGRIAWLYAAHRHGLKASVAWYGRLSGPVSATTPQHPVDLVSALNAPVLGLYGGADEGIPLADVDAMREILQSSTNANARASELIVYPDAPHAFHADYRPFYRRVAAEDGWQRMLEWFRTRV